MKKSGRRGHRREEFESMRYRTTENYAVDSVVIDSGCTHTRFTRQKLVEMRNKRLPGRSTGKMRERLIETTILGQGRSLYESAIFTNAPRNRGGVQKGLPRRLIGSVFVPQTTRVRVSGVRARR